MLDTNAHNNQVSTGIELALPYSAERPKQGALAIWTRKHISKRNNEQYIDVRYNFVTTGQKILNEL